MMIVLANIDDDLGRVFLIYTHRGEAELQLGFSPLLFLDTCLGHILQVLCYLAFWYYVFPYFHRRTLRANTWCLCESSLARSVFRGSLRRGQSSLRFLRSLRQGLMLWKSPVVCQTFSEKSIERVEFSNVVNRSSDIRRFDSVLSVDFDRNSPGDEP